jgi:hypothetical protein
MRAWVRGEWSHSRSSVVNNDLIFGLRILISWTYLDLPYQLLNDLGIVMKILPDVITAIKAAAG